MPFILATENDDSFIASLNYSFGETLGLTNILSAANIPRTHVLIHGGFISDLANRYGDIRNAYFRGDMNEAAYKIREASNYVNGEYVKEVRALLPNNPQASAIIESVKGAWDKSEEEINKYISSAKESSILKASIPLEKPAPIRVKVENSKIVLENEQHGTGRIDFASADRIRASSFATLEAIILELRSTNIDQRYTEAYQGLLRSLGSPLENSSIEDIGLNIQIAKALTEAVREELPTVVIVKLDHVLRTISVLLTQFREWADFVSESEKFDTKDISGQKIIENAEALADELASHGELIDSGVVARLRGMTRPVLTGIVGSEMIIPALVPSLTNLLGEMSRIIVEYAPQIPSKIDAPISIVGGLLMSMLCFKIVDSFAPNLMEYKSFKFLRDILEFGAKYFSPILYLMTRIF
jgi:hypothetical protein